MRARGHLVALRSGRDARRITLLLVLGAIGVAAVTAVLLRVIDPSIGAALALPAIAAGAVAVFLVPVHWIPTITLGVLALFPTRLIPNDGPFNALPPLAILLGIWVLRRVVLGQRPPGDVGDPPETARMGPRFAVYATAGLLAIWLVVSVVTTGGTETSLGWTMSFLAGALLPILVFDARAEARLLSTAFLVLGALVGAYTVLEMLLGGSPIYGSISAALGVTQEFGFSVYRARAAFTHPLFAAAFLCIPAAMGIGRWLTSGKRWALVCGLLSTAGVVATVSRGSIVAIGVMVGFALLVSPVFIGWQNISRWLQLLAMTVIGGIAVLNFGPLMERAESIESQLSAGVRERAVTVALDAAAYSGWLGTGPGTSGETGRLFDTIIIENSMLQLLVSIGLPGLLLFVLLLGSLVWSAWSHNDLGVILALVAYSVAISGFNSLDGVRNMHIIIGFLVILSLHAGTSAPASVLSPATA
ncbi:MAG TPA: O-antigen ligase family protein [Microbacterium sp.]|uniref:O-antigen ligase family protein n=1 Tax=Microbacterium sp. TaxID=51671 RepID=UPI002CF90920|nr:O-antigen ligase family protein [Microbacterium sp.]HWI31639.1 O-antigen ligase family protein [Microbacterium sp.]